jgi:chloramphenicol 3-O phosphotransferase
MFTDALPSRPNRRGGRVKEAASMDKGRILFLNGVTSSGKTSIVEALQTRRDRFFYAMGNDGFQGMVGKAYLRENYWKYLSDAILMMYRTAKLFSDHGRDVLIDGMLVEQPEIAPHYGRLREILRENPLDIVEVYCPLDICRRRNLARGDRYEGQSEEQWALMARDIEYSCRVETHLHTPEECADRIMGGLFPGETDRV